MRLTILKAMFIRHLLMLKSYSFNSLSGIITMYIVFCLMFFGVQAMVPAGSIGRTLEGMLVGYALWAFAIFAFSELAWELTNEAQFGTLEQLHLSPAGLRWAVSANLMTGFLYNTLILSLLVALMMVTTGKYLKFDLIAIVPLLLLTVLGVYGLGFAGGGLQLIFKRVQAFFQIVQFVLVGCIVAPWDRFPWAKYLPLSLGNRLLQRVMLDGERLWELPGDLLITLVLLNLAYLTAGLLVFEAATQAARRKGMLGHY